ncbi:putative arginine rich protein [Mycobacterium tuberculosis]|uniref:hypothetical protein n=1 Tax=Mycobacterium tuberculosis TaxID=1773 RepID=UPI0005E35323|nr:hypothetical protein [Mycobacterium tuberculosis]COU87006.1 putative arginine rich protein [Mycobacterium tuberculosis]COV94972.1 putative arginine rich protein [Mycobacterium tuberculosis]
MIVVRTTEAAEQALTEGQLVCPRRGCGDTLRRWRYGRRRHVRSLGSQVIDVRPQRVRCRRCESTHVLLPAALQPRLGRGGGGQLRPGVWCTGR